MKYESMCAVFPPLKLYQGHLLTCCLGLRTSLRPINDMLSKFLRPIIDMLSEFADFCLANYGNVIGCLMGRG